MRFDKKGDIGFPEAMMSVMIVTVVLTLFLGAFVLNSNNSSDDLTFNEEIINDFSIECSELKYNGDTEAYVQKNGYTGVSILCTVPGEFIDCDLTVSCGTLDGSMFSDRYLVTIKADDGRSIPVLFEVAVCV